MPGKLGSCRLGWALAWPSATSRADAHSFCSCHKGCTCFRAPGPSTMITPCKHSKGGLVQGLQQVTCNKLPAVQWAMVRNGNVNDNGNGNVRTSSKENDRKTGQSVPAAKETKGRPVKLVEQHD